MVAIVIFSIVIAGIAGAHHQQTRSKVEQDITSEVQQHLRGAMMMMMQDIRMAGFDPSGSGDAQFGITDVTDQNGFSQISFGFDENENGVADAGETFTYYVYNDAALGVPCLGREAGSNVDVAAAVGVHALGFAYAYDNDGDGELDTFNNNVIWAVDADGDDLLDANLDDNGDGIVDTNDTEGGGDLAALGLDTGIPLNRVRAVQIWILGRSRVPVRGFTDAQTYVVGPNFIATNDNFKRMLLNNVVKARNLGL
jgi:type IV pilus assembly protein PilW